MRAAVFHQAGQPLVIEQIDEPRPSPHDLILRVRACGICGSDLHMTEPGSVLGLPSGAVMGHEFSGEVVEAGSAVKAEWSTGTAVVGFPYLCCGEQTPCPNLTLGLGSGACARGTGIGLGQSHGAYAEYVRISASAAFRLPGGMSYRAGALVEPLAVGLHAVDMAKLDRDAVVLVVGAGPVGLAVIMWARFLGIRHVLVSERAAVRRQMAARFGASDALNPDEPLASQVERLTGRGPDVIFECVGAPGMIAQTMAEAPRGGRIVVAGVCQQPDTIFPLAGIAKELNLQFVLGYRPADFDYVIAMLASGRIDGESMITDTIDLDSLPGAFEALRKPSGQCKVMVVS